MTKVIERCIAQNKENQRIFWQAFIRRLFR